MYSRPKKNKVLAPNIKKNCENQKESYEDSLMCNMCTKPPRIHFKNYQDLNLHIKEKHLSKKQRVKQICLPPKEAKAVPIYQKDVFFCGHCNAIFAEKNNCVIHLQSHNTSTKVLPELMFPDKSS